jgi:hypothetical protein
MQDPVRERSNYIHGITNSSESSHHLALHCYTKIQAKSGQSRSSNQNHHVSLFTTQNRRQTQIPAPRSQRSALRQSSSRLLRLPRIQARCPLEQRRPGTQKRQARTKTVQGFEPMIGMHCIATLLFTELLLPQLRKAAAEDGKGRTRVVWTSSGMAEEGSLPRMVSISPPSTPEQGVSGPTTDNRNSGPGSLAANSRGGMAGMEIVSVVQNPGNAKGGKLCWESEADDAGF